MQFALLLRLRAPRSELHGSGSAPAFSFYLTLSPCTHSCYLPAAALLTKLTGKPYLASGFTTSFNTVLSDPQEFSTASMAQSMLCVEPHRNLRSTGTGQSIVEQNFRPLPRAEICASAQSQRSPADFLVLLLRHPRIPISKALGAGGKFFHYHLHSQRGLQQHQHR